MRYILAGGLEHFLFSISYMGCHPSHWRTHIFQRGSSTTNQIICGTFWHLQLPFWLVLCSVVGSQCVPPIFRQNNICWFNSTLFPDITCYALVLMVKSSQFVLVKPRLMMLLRPSTIDGKTILSLMKSYVWGQNLCVWQPKELRQGPCS